MVFVEGKAACGVVGCCVNSHHKLAVNHEKVQTLTQQGITLAVGNVNVLSGISHR